MKELKPGQRSTSGLWLVVVLLLPFAFVGVVWLPNKYEAWGGSGIDCDGPMVAFIAVPLAAAYAFVAVGFLRRALKWRQWHALVGAAICAIIAVPLLANGATGIQKMYEQEAVCS